MIRVGDYAFILDLTSALDLVCPPGETLFGACSCINPRGRFLRRVKRFQRVYKRIFRSQLSGTVQVNDDCLAIDAEGIWEVFHDVPQELYGCALLDLFILETSTRFADATDDPLVTGGHIEGMFSAIETGNHGLAQSGHAYRKLLGLEDMRSRHACHQEGSSNTGIDECIEDVYTSHLQSVQQPGLHEHQMIFKVSKKQIKLVERLLDSGSREDAGQARWDDLVRVGGNAACVLTRIADLVTAIQEDRLPVRRISETRQNSYVKCYRDRGSVYSFQPPAGLKRSFITHRLVLSTTKSKSR